MDVLKDKRLNETDFLSRYNSNYIYYHTLDDKYLLGTGYNLLKTTTYLEHKVMPDDNIEALAYKYYGQPIHWWVIAYYNDIQDVFIKLSDQYKTLKIPQISGIRFGDER